jgi:subtilisin family serine protease
VSHGTQAAAVTLFLSELFLSEIFLSGGFLAEAFLSEAATPQTHREIIVRLTDSAPGLESHTGASRIETRGLRLCRAFIQHPRTRPTSASQLFELDPDRVYLLEADDSLAAEQALRDLAHDPDVLWAERNVPREPALDHFAGTLSKPTGQTHSWPDEPLLRDTRQWGLVNAGPSGVYGGLAGADVHALEAWSRSTGSASLRLAIADTGIDPNHPELQATLASGPRIELGVNVTGDPTPSFADSFGHGTAVVGVMAARTGEGVHFDSLGIAGVCGGDGGANPGCRIVPIKITPGHSGLASAFDIARAIVYAADVGARALNLSFAGSGPSRLEREALAYAIVRGCVVVAASGNRGASTAPRMPQYPAAYAADGLCLQVGASDAWDRRAVFSSYGPGLDVVAPGVDVWSTFMTYPSAAGASYPGYVAGSGTSFAAPFVTGIVGLLAAARPELIDVDYQHLIRATADDVATPGVDDETGAGRVNAARALRAVAPGVGIWHDEVAPDTWNEVAEDTLVVGEPGPGALTPARTWPRARLIEVRATVAIPDSFGDSVAVWPRVGGTMCVRGDFRLPYFVPRADVIDHGPHGFTLRGYVYRAPTDSTESEWIDLPLPVDQARFGFTVIGPLAARADVPRALAATRLVAHPNPFTRFVRIDGATGEAMSVFDATGRRVRRLARDGSVGPITWDGRDDAGRVVAPGLYWIRAGRDRGALRVLKRE